jgi:hypothetical protein
LLFLLGITSGILLIIGISAFIAHGIIKVSQAFKSHNADSKFCFIIVSASISYFFAKNDNVSQDLTLCITPDTGGIFITSQGCNTLLLSKSLAQYIELVEILKL